MSDASPIDLSTLLRREEGQYFDRKSLFEGPPEAKRPRDRKSVRSQIAKQVAGFANAEGGVLLLGVEDDGSVTGHAYPDDVVDQMLRVPEERLSPALPAGVRVTHQGHELLLFEVQMAATPVQVVSDGYPLRVDDHTAQVRFEQIQALKTRGLVESYEARPSRRELRELDVDLIERAQTGAGLQSLGSADYLVRRRLADWAGDRLQLRQAAELLFARGLVEHPNAGVRIFRVVGTERRTGLEHNVEERDRIEGALPEVLDQALREIDRLLRRPARLTPGGRFRETSEYPEFSWKEAVLNAVAHRDYAIEGRGVEIWLFDDRMEVTSPGGLVAEVGLDQLLRLERVHASRNPRIVRALVDLGFMRDQGEGIPRMFAEMEGSFLPRPELDAPAQELRVTLRNQTTITERDRRLIDAVGSEGLSPNDFQALLEAHRAGRVDNARMRVLCGLDTLGASALLRGLRDRQLLDLHAAGLASYYTLGPRLVQRLGQPEGVGRRQADRGESDADRRESDADRGESGADRGESNPDRGESDPDRGESNPAREESPPAWSFDPISDLTAGERQLIATLGVRPRTEKLRRAIHALARRRPWRPADLALVLDRRNVEKLTDRHLKVMVHDGLLKRVHPDTPNHPEQAYYAEGHYDAPLFERRNHEED